jgi:ribosome biogenesis GTPase / thiamine phosphate phosphatase
MKQRLGTVLRGINNIYTVEDELGECRLCRIKGKKLVGGELVYNPIAVGDIVEYTPISPKEGLITARRPRRSSFIRWNMKRGLPQVLAANMDRVVCIAAVDNPPLKPRFIDRVIVCSGDTPVTLVINKSDLPDDGTAEKTLALYRELGYEVMMSSLMLPHLREQLAAHLTGLTAAFVGQSGVGKSSLINALIPGARQKTGEISDKYNRGRHVTNHALLIEGAGLKIIDTPGVRELQVPAMDLHELGFYFPEIAEFARRCGYQPCLHRDEPQCAVREAVSAGRISPLRYDSYRKILASIEELQNGAY